MCLRKTYGGVILSRNITIINNEIYTKAIEKLKVVCGENAQFREGQYEAIEATLTHKRTLVVQRTGWGKSMVYFIASKLTKGVTVIISPLLVLMDNQKEAAEKLGLKCIIFNSKVKREERADVLNEIKSGNCDVLFTTPETLYSEDMQTMLPNLEIGLFVIDECHCISDWGHDFRLNYGKLNRVIRMLPENVPVLGTTATANDRVVVDLKQQFGENVFVSRGPLTRDSLHIEILKLESKAERYAWIKNNLMSLPGSGIIYCLTIKDCDNLADFLKSNGMSVRPYHSALSDEENTLSEKLFINNEVKALVATIKLGMGYDKEDIGFIIHFQRPSSMVAYYQQIGRAGRKTGSEAYCYMMTGEEDNNINEHFIKYAFPTEAQERAIVDALDSHGLMSLNEIMRYSNISSKALNKSIMFLLNQNIIYYDSAIRKYGRSVTPYAYQGAYYDEVKKVKYEDLDQMNKYVNETGCLSKYIVNKLNDDTAVNCGKCYNCMGHGILDAVVAPEMKEIAAIQEYIGSIYIDIEARVRWPEADNPFDRNTIIQQPNERGLALSKYNDSGYGEMVAYDKYHAITFRDELVDKAASVLRDKIVGQGYVTITNIPSTRNAKVKDFATRLADRLGLEYRELLAVTGNGGQQKEMQNSVYQYRNARDKIIMADAVNVSGGIILVDDMVDSRWTLTVAGTLLRKAGADKVFPFCLADSSTKED